MFYFDFILCVLASYVVYLLYCLVDLNFAHTTPRRAPSPPMHTLHCPCVNYMCEFTCAGSTAQGPTQQPPLARWPHGALCGMSYTYVFHHPYAHTHTHTQNSHFSAFWSAYRVVRLMANAARMSGCIISVRVCGARSL